MEVSQETIGNLAEFAPISSAFLVERVLDVSFVDDGFGGMVLSEVPVEEPWNKDYDTVKAEGPSRWAQRFDVRSWGLLAAHDR